MSTFLGGWAVMVAVGMIPGTLPAARLVAAARGALSGAAFLASYAATWIGLGTVGFVVLSPLAPAVRWAGAAAVLAVTAAYELSPLKDACMRRCRSPLRRRGDAVHRDRRPRRRPERGAIPPRAGP